MRAKLLVVPAVILAVAACLSSGAAAVPSPVNTTVTIHAEGTDLSGQVRSPAPNRCANNRTVIVMRQIGARGGGDDVRFASDTASLQGTVYRWSTGMTGTPGRIYSKVRPITGCRGDTSDTIRAIQNP